MVLSFVVNQAMYLALARADATPMREALQSLPAIPEDCQWANFVRNHDELTLDRLSDAERAEVFVAFGWEPELQLYGRGLRRRLPTMVGGDGRRMRMLYSLAFALPGTSVLFYGEEIGMAENSRSSAATACARRCNGPPSDTAASRSPRIPAPCAGRSSMPIGGCRRTSMWQGSAVRMARCSTGWSA